MIEADPDLTAWRRHLHRHPELGFSEHATAAFVVDKLQSFGFGEIHTGLGGTGIVATLRAGRSERAIGLRADMDALPIVERGDLTHKSVTAGVMHACGHDGHTAMLLGAARHLAATQQFDGILHFIFQPAEESFGYDGEGGGPDGGANAMIRDGLFERFPMEAIFGIHNRPGLPAGYFGIRPGVIYAAADRFEISVRGKGGHAARPHLAIDPILVAAHLVTALQSVVSRTVDPLEAAVLSICQVSGGSAFNVIPESVELAGTVRTLTAEVQKRVEQGMATVARGVAESFGAAIDVRYTRGHPALCNDVGLTARVRDVIATTFGRDRLVDLAEPTMSGEDFSCFLREKPGCFVLIGNGSSGAGAVSVHNPAYDFNDAVAPSGVAYWSAIAENFLPRF